MDNFSDEYSDKVKYKDDREEKKTDGDDDLHGIVNKISLNKLLVHIFFCCIRIPKNMKNLLLDEGMKVIMEQLEIFNLFMKLYKEEKLQRNIDQKAYIMEMSKDFKKKYKELELEMIKNKEDKSSNNS